MLNKVVIANRGEIACRIIRTCRRLGIATVAVFSDADRSAQHVLAADEAYYLGGSLPSESYLCGEKILQIAKQANANAIHPGYGFLSENADFAEATENAGLIFIGPKAASMRKMGSKAGAKALMQAAGVPVVPGYVGEEQSPEFLKQQAIQIGFPLMIKAAYGGGGKGMRIVLNADEFSAALESCQRESQNAFGRNRVLLERYISSPRHIEFQVFADQFGHTVHLNERECSAQRRYQKVFEETPSPFLTLGQREAMGKAAVQAAKAIDYLNAGTVEFIVAPNGDFYFMEINTRLQVEHPITEMTTGFDLVEWQLDIADGKPIPYQQTDIPQQGHAIEVRLYAEDPEAGFLPASGRLQHLRLPIENSHIRVDSGVVEGDTVSIFYDPMIAKIIVHDHRRSSALARLREALQQCHIGGLRSNIEFLERLIRHPHIINGTIDTSYLDHSLHEFIPDSPTPNNELFCAAVLADILIQQQHSQCITKHSTENNSPWGMSDAWRNTTSALFIRHYKYRDTIISLEIIIHANHYEIIYNSEKYSIEVISFIKNRLYLKFGEHVIQYGFYHYDRIIVSYTNQQRLLIEAVDYTALSKNNDDLQDNRVLSPLPGRVVLVPISVGETVKAGQVVMVMEAMKMELSLKSPRDGVIALIGASEGDVIDADRCLITLENNG